ncbi:hypothetical protein IYZ83_002740 [Wolbachia pipientis]|uniref:hypothetical protein n=1 Tax=Wolbachia pipientis TaxID=955 RepID=UPI001F30FF81|nr:hypothetical protein [Wolbachia pipientis]UIP92115.1 hypothetical protein IYZ83_002740 [Wolbachia pipientis]
MNPRLKKFLVICGYVLLFAACIAAWILLLYLANMFLQFFFPQVSSEPAIELILNILSLVILAVFLGIYIYFALFLQKRLQVAIDLSKMKTVIMMSFLKCIMIQQQV